MKRIFVLVLVLGVLLATGCDSLTGAAVLEEQRQISIPGLLAQMQELNGTVLPSFVASFFDEERVVIYVSMDDGSSLLAHVEVIDGVVVDIGEDEIIDSTIDIFLSEQVINEVALSENKLGSFNDALSRGDVRYEVKGFFRNVKFRALKVALGFS